MLGNHDTGLFGGKREVLSVDKSFKFALSRNLETDKFDYSDYVIPVKIADKEYLISGKGAC